MNGKKGYKGGGYIQNSHSVPISVYEFIKSLTENFSDYLEETDNYSKEELREKYHHFISHVFTRHWAHTVSSTVKTTKCCKF